MPGEMTAGGPGGARVVYVVRSWPRLSQTFIVNEVLGLEQLGLELVIFSMTRADEPLARTQVETVRALVRYLDTASRRSLRTRLREHGRALAASPGRYLGTLAYVLRGTHLTDGYSTASRRACLGHAVHVAATVRAERAQGRPIGRIHAHFAHDPALIGLLAHRLTGIPFSLTAHARDLYGIPTTTLAARARHATAVVTCCRANADYLRPLVERKRLHLIHHGVDLGRFRPTHRPAAAGPPLVLSVGRLVEKKGFPDLLAACAALRSQGLRFRCVICGDGPLRDELTELRDRLGLAGVVTLAGARPPDDLLPLFQAADVFALAPVVGADGDRDGVPNVIVEAMACALPVVATTAGGVADLVRHGENGLLCRPGDVATIARHLGELLGDPARRHEIGRAGRDTVEARFDSHVAARRMASLLGSGREAG